MDLDQSRWRAPGFPLVAVAAGLAGCGLLAAAASPLYLPEPAGTAVDLPRVTPPNWHLWALAATWMAAALVALATLRWWPYLLLAGGVISVLHTSGALPSLLGDSSYPSPAQRVGQLLVLIGVLACAQGLVRTGAVGWGTAVAGAAVGAQLCGVALAGAGGLFDQPGPRAWQWWLTALGVAGAGIAVGRCARGDRAAQVEGWSRLRLVVTGAIAAGVVVILVAVTPEQLAGLLEVSFTSLFRRPHLVAAVLGLAVLLLGALLAAVAGVWALAGGLTAATVQAAAAAPMFLVVYTLAVDAPGRGLAALAGVGLGVVAAASRWRVPLAATGAVLCAAALFIAVAATNGAPQKIIDQQRVVPAMLLLLLLGAVVTALVGATVPVLARRGAAPAVLGPIGAALGFGVMESLQVTFSRGGVLESGYPSHVHHLASSAWLMLTAAVAVSGFGVAAWAASRRAERRQTELVRREAAAAERTRLARAIHDGVLQVLSLVRRHGSELGGRGEELARLANAQEVALRSLITSGGTQGGSAESGSAESGRTSVDLRTSLSELASTRVDIAVPADPVELPPDIATEVRAAVAAALDNVSRHAGAAAHAWVLVEHEPDGVRVTVRDDGPGFPEGRLAEAAAADRLGVAQSMRGRIADLGGTATISSRPGEGTEVEFWLPLPAGRAAN